MGSEQKVGQPSQWKCFHVSEMIVSANGTIAFNICVYHFGTLIIWYLDTVCCLPFNVVIKATIQRHFDHFSNFRISQYIL